MGVMAGIVAALAVLPTAIPLTIRLSNAEHTLATRQAQTAASVAARILEEDGALPPGTRERVQVDHLHVQSTQGIRVYQEGVELPPEVVAGACGDGPLTQMRTSANGQLWALSCYPADAYQVVAAWRPPAGTAREMSVVVLLLAAIVGLVTALGVLRVLTPLSQVSRALERVGAGERGVRLSGTGVVELDAIVDRLNRAARSVEEREVEFLERIRATQEMARMVAHEVRNPLQSMELLTSLITSEDEQSERAALAAAIHQEIRALDHVVERVLREGVAGGGLTLNPARHTLRPIFAQVLSLRGPEARAAGVRLEIGEITDRPVMMDAALMARTVENLVLNALQAVPQRTGHVRVSACEEGEWLCIRVDDNGPGVPEAFGEHVYEMNVSGRAGGTGLGLALVKGVIESHGGYVGHARSPLGGARFEARIPLGEVDVGR